MLLGILLAIVILVCIALAGVVLLQRSEGGALGMGSGPSGFMTTRGAGDLLTRLTWILGSTLFALCLLMTVIQGRLSAGSSVVDRLKIDPLSGDALRPAAPAPGRPAPSPAEEGFGAPAPTVNVAPSTPPTAGGLPGAVTQAPAARPRPAARAAAPQAPAPTVTVAPARGASRTQTPPGTGTGPTDPVAKTLGGVAPADPATPPPKTN